ncbi:hypothetical protein DXA09_08170 [Absiella sp. AM54-8XD]|uniref:Alpha/beta hydrolase n=2 Tax=Erysipelotrichaceae TaxID=128827 RepID=A0ABS9R5M8_9FIRM|nr:MULTISPECIES: hypothetical protein [Bacillota]MCH4284966.1 hypothetical protein [Amedibacillus hominis]RGB55187.1 hypothetical protein DW271_09470 [Absiella sp. AM22-9]RGB62816.1 hypothetical protein DW120_02870 [Absiella sp. AM10-20]RGC22974.1 hypothetical protein DXA09_08170 [Absiella sp. AM54-8XD]RHU09930.1 hypothetical protein DW716_01650 [Absiella sp. AM27-20]
MHTKDCIMTKDIKQEVYRNQNRTQKLMVLFPGMGYTCDKPLLHYAKAYGFLYGYDILCINYGKMTFDKSKVLSSIAPAYEIAKEALNMINLTNYEKIIFISKSLGTVVAGQLSKEYTMDIQNIFLTPLKETIPYMENSEDVTISGDHDPMLSCDNLQLIQEQPITSFVFPNANHSLEVEKDPVQSIDYLHQVAKIYEKICV